MALSFNYRSLMVFAVASSLTISAQAQDPNVPPPPSRPGVSIGGPSGVIFGGGRGLRIGGPNGAQFGGGFGARFGGDNGAQFGGGEGVRIGPRDYGRPPTGQPGLEIPQEEPLGRFIDPGFETARADEALLHYPETAEGALRLKIDGEESEIYPGDTLAIPTGSRTTIQIGRPIGGYGWRRKLKPGVYVFQESGRGWSIAPGQIPNEQPIGQPPQDDLQPTEAPDLNSPEIETLPAPPLPDDPAAQEASNSDQPRRRLFGRRR
jgi:hypothetical protein